MRRVAYGLRVWDLVTPLSAGDPQWVSLGLVSLAYPVREDPLGSVGGFAAFGLALLASISRSTEGQLGRGQQLGFRQHPFPGSVSPGATYVSEPGWASVRSARMAQP